MSPLIFNFLKTYCSGDTKAVDRLITSAFVTINKIPINKNRLIKSYLIKPAELVEHTQLDRFVNLLQSEIYNFDFEGLVELFEFVISPADRIVNGAIYTPSSIREYIITQIFNSPKPLLDKSKIADIACGCGGFLYTAAKALKNKTDFTYFEIFKNNIYGLDIETYSIRRTKLLLTLLAVSEGEDHKDFQFNLFVGDALIFNWRKKISSFLGFDFVIGNPPYVCSRHLTSETKNKLKRFSVCKSGHPDLYIPFFQIGIESLSNEGILGFISMNSFFKSLNGRSLREYFQKNRFGFRIIDFGTEQVFKSRYTYTCLCFITKQSHSSIQYFKSNNFRNLALEKMDFVSIKYEGLNSKNGWNLLNNEIVSKIELTGTPLGKLFTSRNGIATLKNDIYIFTPIEEDNEFYYLQNGSIYPIEKGICKNILNSNKVNTRLSFSKMKEKIIFPYEDIPKPKLLKEQYLRNNYPQAYKYLKSKRSILEQRDKGKGVYENWFAFGRTQSLEKQKHKLFFPHLVAKTPDLLLNSDEDLLFYNGLALLGKSRNDLLLIKKIMESKVFWFYIQNTSKPYTSGYFSFSSNYIRNFGVCNLNNNEISYVLNETNKDKLDKFFIKKYDIKI